MLWNVRRVLCYALSLQWQAKMYKSTTHDDFEFPLFLFILRIVLRLTLFQFSYREIMLNAHRWPIVTRNCLPVDVCIIHHIHYISQMISHFNGIYKNLLNSNPYVCIVVQARLSFHFCTWNVLILSNTYDYLTFLSVEWISKRNK